MQRAATAVILKVDVTTHDDEERTIYYGPFLPHISGAATGFESELVDELEESGRYSSVKTSFQDVFIGDGESDCEVRATR
jgi:hypothetical protein